MGMGREKPEIVFSQKTSKGITTTKTRLAKLKQNGYIDWTGLRGGYWKIIRKTL
jgi:hypothetical protein